MTKISRHKSAALLILLNSYVNGSPTQQKVKRKKISDTVGINQNPGWIWGHSLFLSLGRDSSATAPQHPAKALAMGRLGHPSSFFSSVVVVLLLLSIPVGPTAELHLISM